MGHIYKGWTLESLWSMTDAEREYYLNEADQIAREQEAKLKKNK